MRTHLWARAVANVCHPAGSVARSLLLCVALLLFVAGTGCDRRASVLAGPPPQIEHLERVLVTVPPLIGLVRPLLPDGVDVTALVPAGMSVHGWEPGTLEVARVAKADLVIAVGLGLESGSVDRLTRRVPRIRISDEIGLADTGHSHHHHHEGDGHDHANCEQAATDPHLWLHPNRMRAIVESLAAALRARGIEVPESRVAALLADVDATDTWARQQLAPYAGEAVVTQHGAFSALLAEYGLVELGDLLPPVGVEPTPGELMQFTTRLKERRVGALFTEPQLPDDGVRMVGERAGLPIAELDPLGHGEWLGLIRRNVGVIARTLEGARATRARTATDQEPSNGTQP